MRTSAACALLLGASGARALALSAAVYRCGRVLMCDASEAADSDSVDWSLLQSRFAQVQTAESDARVQQMLQTASNWKDGRCEQHVLLTLHDWVRKLSVARDLCICGTHSGVVVLSDFESGAVLQRWVAPLGGGSEVTAVSFDGEHIISGDASGGVYLRRWRPAAAAGSLPPRSPPSPLCGQHRGAVTGVHWPGGGVAWACSTEKCLSVLADDADDAAALLPGLLVLALPPGCWLRYALGTSS